MGRLIFPVLLLAGFSANCFSQAASPNRPEAAALLQQVAGKYNAAQFYHIEAVEESESKGDLFNRWWKLTLAASVAPGNRYRYEAHGQIGSALKISDGKTETYYNLETLEYTESPVSTMEPATRVMYFWESDLQDSYGLLKSLSQSGTLLSPVYLPDEIITIQSKPVSCYVVQGKRKYRGGPADLSITMTYWIDRDTLLIRKKQSHWEGTIRPYAGHAIENRVTVYPVMELGESASPDSLFAFQPPAGAKRVPKFLDPLQPQDLLAGKPAPVLTLENRHGKRVTLQDFRGKPVLLDFWATWCPPCIAALDPLKKLQEESQQKDLVVLGINEDEDAQTANNFLARRSIPWANFHDDGEIWRAFPSNSGIPYYVLIDANGQIVFSKPSAEESELRAAIAKLGTPPAK